eukprot:11876093-Ditylum_brightwellii.AAC.1
MSEEGLVTQAEYPDPDWEDDVLRWEDEEEAVTEIEEEVAKKETDKKDKAVMINWTRQREKGPMEWLGQKATREERLEAM